MQAAQTLSPSVGVNPPPGPLKFLPIEVVCDKISFGKTWVNDAVAKGEFPPPVRVGGRRIFWVESEVEAWMQRAIAASRSGIAEQATL